MQEYTHFGTSDMSLLIISVTCNLAIDERLFNSCEYVIMCTDNVRPRPTILLLTYRGFVKPKCIVALCTRHYR